MTLQEAKQVLRINWVKGIDCPCCGQFVKKYKRKITGPSCIILINLYKRYKQKPGFYHLNDIVIGVANTGSNDFDKLKFHGFIERKALSDNEKTSGIKRTSGYYSITKRGIMFVEGKITVNKYIYIYNNKFLGFEGGGINIQEALGNNFNYKEIMNQ